MGERKCRTGQTENDHLTAPRVGDVVRGALVEPLDAGPVDEVDQIHLPVRHRCGGTDATGVVAVV